MKSIPLRLKKMIAQFLSEKRKIGSNGWADVTAQDITSLENIVCQLIRDKCEADTDGDRPIEVTIVNRITHDRLDYEPIPRGDSGIGAEEEALDVAECNMAIAVERFRGAYGRVRRTRTRQRKMDKIIESLGPGKTFKDQGTGKNFVVTSLIMGATGVESIGLLDLTRIEGNIKAGRNPFIWAFSSCHSSDFKRLDFVPNPNCIIPSVIRSGTPVEFPQLRSQINQTRKLSKNVPK
jgi:hypothetical protein